MAQINALTKMVWRSKAIYSLGSTQISPALTMLVERACFMSSKEGDQNEEKYNFQAAEFSSSRARDTSGQNIDVHYNNAEPNAGSGGNSEGSKQGDSHIESYDTRGGLNLSSVMQTTVPEPYDHQGKGTPTHLNMPGGQVGQRQKYLSDDLQRTHYQKNSREYHTFANHTGMGFLLLPEVRGPVVNLSTQSTRWLLHAESPSTPPPPPLPPATDAQASNQPKLTQRMRLKQAVRDYGATVMVFHISFSLCFLGGVYLAVSSGLDVGSLLSKLPLDSSLVQSSLATGVSTFALSYAVHKLLLPVRMGVTLAAVPLIVRYLRKIGFLKPPKS